MKVVIIGSGNVATVLGKRIRHAGHEIIQVVSRQVAHAKRLADELGCGSADLSGRMEPGADLYLVAVTDNALYQLNKQFHLSNKLVVHTAGSVSKDILREISVNYGVIYPLQSLYAGMDTEKEIPLLIDANSGPAREQISAFSATLSSNIAEANDEQRLRLHVAAVVVSNFTNHLYMLAEEFCKKEQVDFKLLIPLIRETATRIETRAPKDVQTGPASRNDVFTLDRHIKLLADYPALKYVYVKLTESIMHPRK